MSHKYNPWFWLGYGFMKLAMKFKRDSYPRILLVALSYWAIGEIKQPFGYARFLHKIANDSTLYKMVHED